MLAEHPVLALLPDTQVHLVQNLVRVSPLVQQARADAPNGEADAFGRLYTECATTDDVTRRMLVRTLPGLLADADPLAPALRGCPPEVAAAFCARLDDRLAPRQPDIALARRVFGVLARPGMLDQADLAQRLAESFDQVRRWPRRDLNTLAQMVEGDPGMARPFRAWRDARRGGLTRKIRGGPPAER